MYKLTENVIQRLSDDAFIPKSADNRDYNMFLRDVSEEGLVIVEDNGEDGLDWVREAADEWKVNNPEGILGI